MSRGFEKEALTEDRLILFGDIWGYTRLTCSLLEFLSVAGKGGGSLSGWGVPVLTGFLVLVLVQIPENFTLKICIPECVSYTSTAFLREAGRQP